MNTEHLSCQRITAGVVFPPMQLHHQIVNQIYTDITGRYPYQTLQHLPDGARMANPDGDFFIQVTRLQVNESVHLFQPTKEKIVDLFMMAQERLNVPLFMTFGVKLTAFLPLHYDNAANILEKSMLEGVSDKLAILGDGRKGVGFRIVLHQDGIHEIKIEPFFNDPTQIYVELDIQHPTQFNDLSLIEPKIDSAYNYLNNEVANFLESL